LKILYIQTHYEWVYNKTCYTSLCREQRLKEVKGQRLLTWYSIYNLQAPTN